MMTLILDLQEVWQDVLRCVSRWELLQTIHSGGPSDAMIFAQPSESPLAVKKRTFFSALRSATPKEQGILCLLSCTLATTLSFMTANIQSCILPLTFNLILAEKTKAQFSAEKTNTQSLSSRLVTRL